MLVLVVANAGVDDAGRFGNCGTSGDGGAVALRLFLLSLVASSHCLKPAGPG